MVELAPVIVTEVPLAASDMPTLLLEPTNTFPKLRLVGVAVTTPATLPDPERGTLRVGLAASDSAVTLPLQLIAEGGVKTTLSV